MEHPVSQTVMKAISKENVMMWKYEGHFINNAQYFLYVRVYFILGSISLQSFYVVPLLLNDRDPTFRKIFYSI